MVKQLLSAEQLLQREAVYVFGFPLSFMKVEDKTSMMNKIISELM